MACSVLTALVCMNYYNNLNGRHKQTLGGIVVEQYKQKLTAVFLKNVYLLKEGFPA